MGIGRGRSIMAAAILAITGVLPGAPAVLSQGPDGCEAVLLSLPIETLQVPDGWAWTALRPAWSGTLAAVTASGDGSATIDLVLACDPDAAATFARAAEVRAALGLEEVLAAAPVGEESVAVRTIDGEGATRVRIDWHDGPIVASVSAADGPETLTDLSAVALAVDALLQGGPSPTASASPSPSVGPSASPVPSAAPSSVPSSAPASVPPASAAPSSAPARVIRLELTGALQITDPDGHEVRVLRVTPGETIAFRLRNTAGYPHSFFIGSEERLIARDVAGLPGLEAWSTDRPRTLIWTVPPDVTELRFGCIVPGHYPMMHGSFTTTRPTLVGPLRPRLTLSTSDVRLGELPLSVTVRYELRDGKGRPVSDLPVTLTFSPPGLPTMTTQVPIVDGVARWTFDLVGESAERGSGFVTARIEPGDGIEGITATKPFLIR